MKRKIVVTLAFLLLVGCSLKAEFSVMKQWDRPAEKVTVEDTSHNVKQPPRTVIETQDPIRVNPTPDRDVTPPAVPGMKPMKYEVPEVIVPQATPIQYMYIHEHGDDVVVQAAGGGRGCGRARRPAAWPWM